jgi:hypothetical protein
MAYKVSVFVNHSTYELTAFPRYHVMLSKVKYHCSVDKPVLTYKNSMHECVAITCQAEYQDFLAVCGDKSLELYVFERMDFPLTRPPVGCDKYQEVPFVESVLMEDMEDEYSEVHSMQWSEGPLGSLWTVGDEVNCLGGCSCSLTDEGSADPRVSDKAGLGLLDLAGPTTTTEYVRSASDEPKLPAEEPTTPMEYIRSASDEPKLPAGGINRIVLQPRALTLFPISTLRPRMPTLILPPARLSPTPQAVVPLQALPLVSNQLVAPCIHKCVECLSNAIAAVYKCAECAYDLCSQCVSISRHPHVFLRVKLLKCWNL